MRELSRLLNGWDGYQLSLLHAVTPLNKEQLAWRPVPDRRSVGELIRHVSLGRITWLSRIGAPGVEEIVLAVPRWYTDPDSSRHVVEESIPSDQPEVLSKWLSLSWKPIDSLLHEWTLDDLFQTYPHRFRGTDYAVSRQWTIWRIMSHDIHHGGQLALMLSMQGIDAFELRALGGHITVPDLARHTNDPAIDSRNSEP
jgi:uncharacterized damage-inducible protein DinB